VNLHLESRLDDFAASSSSLPINTQAPAHVNLIVERLLADVSAVVAHIGPERVIVENVAYWGANGEVLRPATEPGIIRRIVEETGCGLLLDISHARIAARNQGVDETCYLTGLPLERIRELHITGVHAMTGGWRDPPANVAGRFALG
jgi:uncharacterized protein (UPF0276 family)